MPGLTSLTAVLKLAMKNTRRGRKRLQLQKQEERGAQRNTGEQKGTKTDQCQYSNKIIRTSKGP